MPKLAHVLEALNKKPEKEDRTQETLDLMADEILLMGSYGRKRHSEVLGEIRNAIQVLSSFIQAIPKTDLKPVLDSIVTNRVTVDLKPILDAMDKGFRSIPKQEKVDLSPQFLQVLQRIDHLAMKVDAIEMELPEISVNVPKIKEVERQEKEEKKEYDLTVTARNAGGGIKSVRIREV